MNKNISFSLMMNHGKLISYNLTYKQFLNFRLLVQIGGEKTIAGDRLEVKNGCLLHYKKPTGQPNYSTSLDGILDILDRAEAEARY